MRFEDPRDWQRLASWLSGPVAARPDDNCALVHCEPGWSWQVRVHDHDLWLVVDGRGRATIDGVDHNLVPGDLLHLPPGCRGGVEQDPEHRFTIAYCHYDWWETTGNTPVVIPDELRTAPYLRLVNPGSVQDRLLALIRLAQDRQPLADLQRSGLLQMILVDVYRQQGAAAGFGPVAVDARIEQVMTTLRANPGERVTLDQAAAQAGMSPQYFSRTFTAQVGLSFRDFCLANRLDRARMLLVESPMTVGEIARALGVPRHVPVQPAGHRSVRLLADPAPGAGPWARGDRRVGRGQSLTALGRRSLRSSGGSANTRLSSVSRSSVAAG